MLVVTFAAYGGGNCVVINGNPFIYAKTPFGECVLSAHCPHRGGPLHLAALDGERRQLLCPWHGGRTRLSRVTERAVPAVRRGGVVTAVFPVPAGTTFSVRHLPVSADLAGASGCAAAGSASRAAARDTAEAAR